MSNDFPAEEYLKSLRRTPPKIEQQNCALLIIDMQEYFRGLASPIIPNIQKIIQTCRERSILVIFTRHAHPNDQKESGMLGKWWADLIVDGSASAEIIPEMQIQKNEKIIHKKRYSAFYQTDLHSHLQKKEIRQIILGGVMTNLCCETSARDAFVRDYEVYFLTDGTATIDNKMHQATLLNLAFGFAYLLSCDEMLRSLELR